MDIFLPASGTDSDNLTYNLHMASGCNRGQPIKPNHSEYQNNGKSISMTSIINVSSTHFNKSSHISFCLHAFVEKCCLAHVWPDLRCLLLWGWVPGFQSLRKPSNAETQELIVGLSAQHVSRPGRMPACVGVSGIVICPW